MAHYIGAGYDEEVRSGEYLWDAGYVHQNVKKTLGGFAFTDEPEVFPRLPFYVDLELSTLWAFDHEIGGGRVTESQ